MDETTQNIKDYFNGFMTDIKVYSGSVNGRDAIGFDGIRNGNKYSFSTNQVYNSGEMLFHWLENIRGEIVQVEETMILENHKNDK